MTLNIQDSHYARYSYEQFLFLEPEVDTKGLWQKGFRFYIVCPGLEENSLSHCGMPLKEKFEKHIKVVTSPISLIRNIPENAVLVPPRTIEQIMSCDSAPLNMAQFRAELALNLKGFPQWTISDDYPNFIIYLKTDLTFEQATFIKHLFTQKLGTQDINIEIKVENTREYKFAYPIPPGYDGSINIVPESLHSQKHSTNLRRLLEADDDLWLTNRVRLFSENLHDPMEFVPSNFDSNVSTCLINATVNSSASLKSLVHIYKRIIIALPLAERFNDIMHGWGTNAEELIELAKNDSIQFILPQPIDRYELSFIQKLADLDNRPLLFSRALVSAVITDSRKRFPLLYPPLGIEQKQLILQGLLGFRGQNSEFIRTIAYQLGKMWSGIDALNFKAAMSAPWLGLGPIAACIWECISKKDYTVEFSFAADAITWGAAFNAHVFPRDAESYSEYNASSIISSIYSHATLRKSGQLDVILDGLFLVNNDCSILEIAETFKNDSDKLNNIMTKIVECQSQEESTYLIQECNKKVKKYEKRMTKLKKLNIDGLFAGAIAMPFVAKHHPIAFYSPISTAVAVLIANQIEGSKFSCVSDYIKAALTATPKDAVMLSRLRNTVKNI